MISKLNIISNRNLGVFFDIYAITAIKVNIKKEKIAMIRRTMQDGSLKGKELRI